MIDDLIRYSHSPDADYAFSIVIPSWNNLDYLKCCIASIRRHSVLKLQVIVFINEGRDGTLEWLEEQGNVDILYSPVNVGICYGVNLCRSLVKSDYILYMNDDMYVLPGWDQVLHDEIVSLDTKLFMLSATMIEPHRSGNRCVVVKDFGDTLESFKEDRLLAEYQTLSGDDWSGSTWPPNLVHRDLWDLVGGLSVEYSPGMYSDPDFSKKIYDAGVRLFKGKGNSLVYHFGSKSTGRARKNKGRDQFVMKWGFSAKSFTHEILRSGQPYNGEVGDHHPTLGERIFNKIKAIQVVLRRD